MSVNPKTAAGLRKLPLDLVPPIALAEEAAVYGLGADCPSKAYGRWNWRSAPAEAETYVAAIERHLLRWRSGEDCDRESGVSHLAHIRACCGILRDAQDRGTLVDDRRGSPAVLRVMDGYDAAAMPVVSAGPGAP